MFEYFSRAHRTPVAILRLNYATEMRYGVLVDLARRVRQGEPIDVTMGYFNVIWQADANAMALAALAHASSPPFIVNLAGPEELGVRAACTELARLLGVEVSFTGQEARDALLSNGARGWERLGAPRVDASRLLEWTADWTRRGGESLGQADALRIAERALLIGVVVPGAHARSRGSAPVITSHCRGRLSALETLTDAPDIGFLVATF